MFVVCGVINTVAPSHLDGTPTLLSSASLATEGGGYTFLGFVLGFWV
jgi:hypothetical protein